MATSINDIGKRGRGRPATDSKPILVRLQPNDLAALDAFRTADELMTRPQAIRAALTDWLRTHGFAISNAPEPTGPATNVLKTMDAAVTADRRGRKKSSG